MQYVHSEVFWKYLDSSKMEASWPLRRHPGRALDRRRFHIGRKVASRPRMFRSAGGAPVSAITTGLRLMDERDARCYPQVVPSPGTGRQNGRTVYENRRLIYIYLIQWVLTVRPMVL